MLLHLNSILVVKALLPPPSPPAGGARHWTFSVIYSAVQLGGGIHVSRVTGTKHAQK